MKAKRLSVIAIILVIIMLLPIITSCSCSVTPPPDTGTNTDTGTDTDTVTDTGTGDKPDKPDDGKPITDARVTVPSVRHLRIKEIGKDSVTFLVNISDKNAALDVRFGNEKITESNFDSAEKADATITLGDAYAEIVVKNFTADKNTKHYVAVRAKTEEAAGNVESVRAGGVEIIPIDPTRVNMVYNGQVNRDYSARLFDEQHDGDPLHGKSFMTVSDYSDKNNLIYKEDEDRYGITFKPVIDLSYLTYIDCIYVNYRNDAYNLTVRTSDTAASYDNPSAWKTSSVTVTDMKTGWNKIEIGKNAQYILLEYKNGELPSEVLVYGYTVAEGDVKISTEKRTNKKLGEMMGLCTLVNSPSVTNLKCVSVIREYHNVGWSYNNSVGFIGANSFDTPHGVADLHYSKWSAAGLTVIPCLQWKSGDADEVAHVYDKTTGKLNSAVASYEEKFLPSTYLAYADLMFNYAARYGSNKEKKLQNVILSRIAASKRVGMGYIEWIEMGNEPNGEDSSGYNAFQLAALTSAAYDGHCKTIGFEVLEKEGKSESMYFFGGKNADPNIKLAMAGLAGIANTMIGSMVYWMKSNRPDGSIAMDAFNVHTYFKKTMVMNDQTIDIGTSPEEFGLVKALSKLAEFRDKYYPDTELWLTEFGWDTAQQYTVETAAHEYTGADGHTYTGREVQAMWLTRAFLILSALGVDKADVYMELDTVKEDDCQGKYGTCGIVDVDGNKKMSYYYLYALKNTLGEYRFTRELSTGNPNVWAYEFTDDKGNTTYALWCPTSDGTRVDNFKINVGANGATLTELKDQEIEGVKTELTVDGDGAVTVNVSETPIFITLKK